VLAIPLTAVADLTLTNRRSTPMGVYKVVTADVLFDSSYASSGGEALTAATLGLNTVDFVMITPDSTGAAGYNFGYANAKLWCGGLENTLAVNPAVFAATDTLTAVTSLPDSTGLTIYVDVPSTNGTIAFEEMDATTDLSAVKVSIMAFGK
jgi:hypothetical protein